MAEAHYLLAIINSESLYDAVTPFMPKGQFGARHLQKQLWKLPIPEFNATEAAAQGAARSTSPKPIADAGKAAADGAWGGQAAKPLIESSAKTDPASPLTLLVGNNSTGKTSFLAMIRALWEIAFLDEAPDFQKDPYDLGTFRDIAHNRGRGGGQAREPLNNLA